MLDEREYQAERAEQQAREGGVVARRSRRGFDRPTVPEPVAQRPIRKSLPHEWFIDHGANAEMRWEAMRGQGEITPVDRFFVRNHTSTPTIDPSTYRLVVTGDGIAHRASFSLDDLTALSSTEITAAIECAGNGRSLFKDQQASAVPGTPWKLGGIGVGRWRGVLLGEVLDRLGVRRDAIDVMPVGLDGNYVDDGVDHGRVRRPMPIAKAMDDVLLAYEMNWQQLPADHGFPLRVVVPGWAGVASVKWVGSIEVSTRPLFSPWNTSMYRMTGPEYVADSPPLAEQPVKSAFELAWGAPIDRGAPVELHGRSWSGRGSVRSVEVSTDGGASWRLAQTYGPNRPRAWVRWSITWDEPARGEHELLARATDSAGLTQPDAVRFNDNGYQFWAVARHPVTVR
jgi:DMSO/TMAO reductase YedYZ molybdopterin-dependent catalytic subunit